MQTTWREEPGDVGPTAQDCWLQASRRGAGVMGGAVSGGYRGMPVRVRLLVLAIAVVAPVAMWLADIRDGRDAQPGWYLMLAIILATPVLRGIVRPLEHPRRYRAARIGVLALTAVAALGIVTELVWGVPSVALTGWVLIGVWLSVLIGATRRPKPPAAGGRAPGVPVGTR